MIKSLKLCLAAVVAFVIIFGVYKYIASQTNDNEIVRIPPKNCPDKEFEGQGDGALYLNGKKYYTEKEDWDWIVQNCPDYAIYEE